MKVSTTDRGFEFVDFQDVNGEDRSLQQSSACLSLENIDHPGASAVWLGVSGNRMHLSRDQVIELLDFLGRWVFDGMFGDVEKKNV